MGLRIAKIDQESIPKILRNVAVKALDALGTGCLVGTHHLAIVFGVELTGQAGRVHHVAKEDGELAAFGVGRR
jgi:hypothetical protein